jgi:hypothetical protein
MNCKHEHFNIFRRPGPSSKIRAGLRSRRGRKQVDQSQRRRKETRARARHKSIRLRGADFDVTIASRDRHQAGIRTDRKIAYAQRSTGFPKILDELTRLGIPNEDNAVNVSRSEKTTIGTKLERRHLRHLRVGQLVHFGPIFQTPDRQRFGATHGNIYGHQERLQNRVPDRT